MIDEERFEQIKNKITNSNRERIGIGTLSEKTVHAILKEYYEPDTDYHEIPIEGYVADIYKDNEIIEIQTANFNRMRSKLDRFLPLYPVTIIYPIPRMKWLIWIDEETGQLSKKNKSPKRGSFYEAFRELYKIKQYLADTNLRIKIVMLDIEEYRLLNGWSKDRKRGSCRYDRIPLKIVEEFDLSNVRDYMQLVPFDMPDRFTTKNYAKAAKVSISIAQTALNILNHVGVVKRVGKLGNSFLYEVMEG